jgi:hypothetical protein
LKVVILLPITCFDNLDLIIKACSFVVPHGDELEDEDNMFWVGASFEESFQAFFIGELSLLERLFTLLATCENPIVWWCNHGGQFPNVTFLAKHILSIPRS